MNSFEQEGQELADTKRVFATLLVVKDQCLTQELLAERLKAANEARQGDDNITRVDTLAEDTPADCIILFPPGAPFMWVSAAHSERIEQDLDGSVVSTGISQPIFV